MKNIALTYITVVLKLISSPLLKNISTMTLD